MKNEKILRKIETKPTLANHYRNGNSVSNLNGNIPTTRKFKTQEPQRMKQEKCTIVKSMLEIIVKSMLEIIKSLK
ncbi:hypothetical protein [Helicobacter pylori]|uniref:hypothetical protein n=1 Tax=Helicobacter pylori TaxID=210 RepID=UPI00111B832D|nr:hypothetical protein [Helicobacter pylori]